MFGAFLIGLSWCLSPESEVSLITSLFEFVSLRALAALTGTKLIAICGLRGVRSRTAQANKQTVRLIGLASKINHREEKRGN